MKHTAPSRVNAEPTDLPIVRLDAQDLEQSLPIREYLEQNGCAVVVNRRPSLPATYHMISGDADFVKEATASAPKSDVKLFVVLFLKNREKVPAGILDINVKIAAVSGTAISTRNASQIFAYFFTSDEEVFYLENDERLMLELKPVLPRVNVAKTLKKRGTLRVLLIAVAIVVAPVMWYLVSLAMIAAVQWVGVSALKRGDITRIRTVVRLTTYWIGQAKRILTVSGLPIRAVGAGSAIRGQERVLSVLGDIVTAEDHASELMSQSRAMASMLIAPGEAAINPHTSLPAAIDRIRLLLDGFTNALGLSGAQLRLIATDNQFPFTIPFVRDMTHRGEEEIEVALVQAGTLRNLLALYRASGGFDTKKTYLLLLQNSMELRPTGGFIGSVATVTVADGTITTPVVQDVYALDGQLKGHVDPPLPIKELLQQEHWYLRDSNWDPDFAVSGEKAAWFYQKETGQSVDGVIAISTPLLTELLGVTGPLDLPDYNDRITKENFFGKSLFYTKADFFPGSTQKKDFLGSLMVAIMSRLTSGTTGDAAGLMRVVGRALARGDIQFWFPQRQIQATVKQAGWAGDIVQPDACEHSSPSCVVNRVAMVESNMGVNKANFFIKRTIKNRVDLSDDGGIDGTIAITYKNQSADDAAISGGGVYLTYLRVFLPADALVLSAALDGMEIPGKAAKIADRTTPYRDADETTGGSSIASVAFTVPPGMERIVTITYRRGIPLTFTDNESAFVFSMRKQPGMTDTTLDAAIGYPAGWRSDATTETFANIREVRYNTDLDQTKVFTERFTK